MEQVPVLCTLSNEQIWQLLKHMTEEKFNRGDIVFRKGDNGDTFYIVQDGTFRVFDGQ